MHIYLFSLATYIYLKFSHDKLDACRFLISGLQIWVASLLVIVHCHEFEKRLNGTFSWKSLFDTPLNVAKLRASINSTNIHVYKFWPIKRGRNPAIHFTLCISAGRHRGVYRITNFVSYFPWLAQTSTQMEGGDIIIISLSSNFHCSKQEATAAHSYNPSGSTSSTITINLITLSLL